MSHDSRISSFLLCDVPEVGQGQAELSMTQEFPDPYSHRRICLSGACLFHGQGIMVALESALVLALHL